MASSSALIRRCQCFASQQASIVRSYQTRWSSSDAKQATPAASTSSTNTTHYRITLRRSVIGLPESTRRIVATLGLRKRLSSVYLPIQADIAGKILATKELLHVENVRRLDKALGADVTSEGQTKNRVPNRDAVWINERNEVVDWGGKRARKAPRGFFVVGNIANEERHREILAARTDAASLSSPSS